MILTLATGKAAWANVADTDTSFGNSGVAVTDLGGSADQNQSIFIGTGDVIYAVGTDSSDGGDTFSHYVITRTSADGKTLDSNFGTGGKLSIPFSVEPNGFIGNAIAIDETNSFIYLAGNACVGGTQQTPCSNVGVVLRFNFAGALDNNWGSAGIATISTAHQAQAEGLVIKPNCEVLVAGADQNGTQNSETDDALVALFHFDGSPDNSFGTSGVKIIDFGTDCDRAQGLTFDASGNIIVTGRAGAMGTGPNFCKTNRMTALTRLSSTGVVDNGFGTGGFTKTNFGETSTDSPNSVVQAGGKIAALVGVNFDTGSGVPSVGVARFNSNGTVDNGFGTNGLLKEIFTPPTGFNPQGGVDTQGTGKPVLGGSFPTTQSNQDAALLRLLGSAELASTKGNSCSIDITPDAFSFTSLANQTLSTVVTSNSVAISGINNPAPISVSANDNSLYSIGTGAFTSTPGTINNGDSVRVRHTTSALPNTTVTTTLTIGGVQETFSSTTVPADTTPDPITFAPQTGVELNTPITSNTVQITGINAAAPISIAGGTASGYSIGCTGTFTSTPGTINNNDMVCVQQTSSALGTTPTTTTLTVGTVAAPFQVTTRAADTTPDPFTFDDQTGVATGTPTLSNIITVSGIDAPAPISISGGDGQFSINGGAFTNASTTVSNGQMVQLRLTSSSSAITPVSTTLNIGGVNGTFNVTTGATDTTPDPFTFINQSNVPQSTVITSAPITVSGINASAPILVAGGMYDVNGSGNFTSAAGTVNNGDMVRVQHTSGGTTNAAVHTTLTIGGVSGTFTSTTTPDTTPDQFAFTNQNNAPLNTVITSNTVMITGVDVAVPVSVTGGEYSISCAANGFTNQAGMISNTQTVCVRQTSSAADNTPTSTTLAVGGVNGAFTSTTGDGTPDAFSFTDQTGVAPSTLITSNAITVTGITIAAPISVTGGSYSVGAGAFTTEPGTVNSGDTVRVQHTSSANFSTATDTTLTVGGVSDTFTSTTLSGQTISTPGGEVTVTTSQGQLTISSVSTPANAPSGTYPVGFFNFTVTGLPATGTPAQVNIVFTLPAGINVDSYVKCTASSCAPLASGVVISGNQLTLTITDNGAGDGDGAQGSISDPGAPRISPPSGGGGAMGWLTLLALGVPALARRRRS